MLRFIQPNIFLYFFLLILGISGLFFAVIWSQAEGFYAFITFATSGGLGVALYIYYTKKHYKQLVCPIGSDRNAVITSRYANFLGVPLEYWGIFYCAVIIAVYIILIFAPWIIQDLFLCGIKLFTTTALLFSLYLLFLSFAPVAHRVSSFRRAPKWNCYSCERSHSFYCESEKVFIKVKIKLS